MESAPFRADPDDRPTGMLQRAPELAAAFDRAASVYDARPGYPEQVFTLLRERCGLRPAMDVLEIGPGVGQATLPLIGNGARVVAVEPGRALARRLRERTPDDAVTVVVSDFEGAEVIEDSFDMVVAATAFHWLDPDAGIAKAARLLRDGGWLALWWTIWGDSSRPDPFHEALVPVLQAKAPHLNSNAMSADAFAADIAARMASIPRSGAFGPVQYDVIRWEGTHTPAQLRAMFSTFAAWITLDEPLRTELLDDVELLARDGFSGTVRRPYQTLVYTAQRLPRGR